MIIYHYYISISIFYTPMFQIPKNPMDNKLKTLTTSFTYEISNSKKQTTQDFHLQVNRKNLEDKLLP